MDAVVKKTWTRDQIIDLMRDSDAWLYRGLLAVYDRQTSQEKAAKGTVEDNGAGFTWFDGEMLSSFATQLRERGTLSQKQRAIARRRMTKYARQLAEIANGGGGAR